MTVTDAQVHVWSRVRPGGRAHYPGPFGHNQLIPLMVEAGVDRAILVPPSWSDDENAVALSAARADPRRFAVMGVLALDQPESRDRVAGWNSQPGMLGLRQTFHTEQLAARLWDGTIEWFWAAAQAAQIPVMIYPPGRLEHIERIARDYPQLRLVIDHMGMPPVDRTSGNDELDIATLLRLAPLKNVGVKISGLPLFSRTDYPFLDVHDCVWRVVEAFGANRSFWGSDITRLSCSYVQAVSMVAEVLPGLDADDMELIMGRGLSEWLGWPT